MIEKKIHLLVLFIHQTTAVRDMHPIKLKTFGLLHIIRDPPHNWLGFRGYLHLVKEQNTADHVQVGTGGLEKSDHYLAWLRSFLMSPSMSLVRNLLL